LPHRDFHGLHVLSLESRRSSEIARLIETYKGVPVSAPAVQEVHFSDNADARRFAKELIDGGVDIVVFLTGVGARALLKVVSEVDPPEPFLEALRRVRVVARGPKPLAVLREWNVPVVLTAPEPCTWRELLRGMDELPDGLQAQRIAVQEYGVSNPELLEALRERGAIVRAVAVYQWALPEDIEPLRQAITALVHGQVQVALFTAGIQVTHLFDVADKLGLKEKLGAAFRDVFVASIGPTTTIKLGEYGIQVDLESAHPKMGMLVKAAAEHSGEKKAN